MDMNIGIGYGQQNLPALLVVASFSNSQVWPKNANSVSTVFVLFTRGKVTTGLCDVRGRGTEDQRTIIKHKVDILLAFSREIYCT